MLIGLVLSAFTAIANGQDVKPYKEGPVTQISYIKVKPGRFDDYMKFLDTTYKSLLEANKKAGLITGYAVYSAEARNPQEPDLILAVTYANMAALDRTDRQKRSQRKSSGPTVSRARPRLIEVRCAMYLAASLFEN